MTAWKLDIPVVGQSAERSRLVTARDIELFTELSGDYNPLHYDEQLAAGTSFGAIVVQGVRVTGDDDVVALAGTAVCYTFALPAAAADAVVQLSDAQAGG